MITFASPLSAENSAWDDPPSPWDVDHPLGREQGASPSPTGEQYSPSDEKAHRGLLRGEHRHDDRLSEESHLDGQQPYGSSQAETWDRQQDDRGYYAGEAFDVAQIPSHDSQPKVHERLAHTRSWQDDLHVAENPVQRASHEAAVDETDMWGGIGAERVDQPPVGTTQRGAADAAGAQAGEVNAAGKAQHSTSPVPGPIRYEAPQPPEPMRLVDVISRLALGTVAVLITCVVSLVLARRWLPQMGGGMEPTGSRMRLLSSIRLSNRAWLQLVEADGRRVLVGCDTGGVKVITPLAESFPSSLDLLDSSSTPQPATPESEPAASESPSPEPRTAELGTAEPKPAQSKPTGWEREGNERRSGGPLPDKGVEPLTLEMLARRLLRHEAAAAKR